MQDDSIGLIVTMACLCRTSKNAFVVIYGVLNLVPPKYQSRPSIVSKSNELRKETLAASVKN